MTQKPLQLGGVAEISDLFGVPRTTVSMWDTRRATSGFPEPVERLAMGPIYRMDEVAEWHRDKYTVGEQLEIPEEGES